MSDPGYEYLIERDPEFAADDGYDGSYWVNNDEIKRGRYNEGTYWPTPENERIPIYTLELSREDDDGSHDETPMKYSVFYYSDDTAFAAAENLADEFANEDGKFYVHVIAGEYMIDGSTDIYGDPYVQDSIQTGRGWKMMESRKKLVKEGAGAGYDVGISDLEIGEVTEVKALGDGDYSFTATIKPGNYEISAESYYDDFFWDLHESGINPEAKIDSGVIHGTISIWENTDDPEEWVRYQVEGNTFNLSFMYGAGWMHANLPEDGKLYIDQRIKITPELYFSVDDIQLDALDLAQAVNDGYASLDDRYNDEDGEPMNENSGRTMRNSKMKRRKTMNEVSGWKLEDEDLTLVNTERDGDKLYIVKLWWGSGYQLDCYNAYAFNEEEALNYVVAYIEKTDPESLETIDENANDYLQELVDEGEAASLEEAYEHPYFEETYLWVDATREGAEQGHYIYHENLTITEYPKEHDYPLAKGVKRVNESDDDDLNWHEVTDAFEDFEQRLWSFTKQDIKGRRDAFSRCTNAMEKAMREFYNEVVYDGED